MSTTIRAVLLGSIRSTVYMTILLAARAVAQIAWCRGERRPEIDATHPMRDRPVRFASGQHRRDPERGQGPGRHEQLGQEAADMAPGVSRALAWLKGEALRAIEWQRHRQVGALAVAATEEVPVQRQGDSGSCAVIAEVDYAIGAHPA